MSKLVDLQRITIILLIWLTTIQLNGQDNFDHLRSGQIIGLSFKTWPQDIVGISKAPFQNRNKTLGVLGTTLGLMLVDKPTQRFVQDHIDPIFDWDVPGVPGISNIQVGTRALFGGATNGYILSGLTAYYLGSLAFKHKRGQVGVMLTYKAIATSYVVSHIVLKSVFARKRPYTPIDGPFPNSGLPTGFTTRVWDFGNFEFPSLQSTREGAAFPSFHFTMYFAIARVLYRTFDNPWLGYGIAAVGLLPDFDVHNHWVSDMFAGAMIGTVIGEVIYNNFVKASNARQSALYQPTTLDRVKRNMSITPAMTIRGSLGLSLSTQF